MTNLQDFYLRQAKWPSEDEQVGASLAGQKFVSCCYDYMQITLSKSLHNVLRRVCGRNQKHRLLNNKEISPCVNKLC